MNKKGLPKKPKWTGLAERVVDIIDICMVSHDWRKRCTCVRKTEELLETSLLARGKWAHRVGYDQGFDDGVKAFDKRRRDLR